MLRKPEIIVFAGPNGSGKSTITKIANIIDRILMLMISKGQIIVPIVKQHKWLIT